MASYTGGAGPSTASPVASDDGEDDGVFVHYPDTDIAQNEFLDGIKVGVPGRMHFQKIYVRTPNGKKSTTTYDPTVDAPKDETLSILPTTEEKQGRPETSQFLVVGLVLASEPSKYSTKSTGKARDLEREQARKTRGTLPAEANILRAVVPITDTISDTSIKYYVACHPSHGLCNNRVITRDAIFFFSEFWADISPDLDVKNRRIAIGSACKRHAATTKPPPERAQTAIIKAPTLTVSIPIAVTEEMNAFNQLFMHHAAYEHTNDPAHLVGFDAMIKRIAGDVTKIPNKDATLLFFKFEGPHLEKATAEKLTGEIMTSYPNISALNPELVIRIYAILREDNKGDRLRCQDLVPFLLDVHRKANASWSTSMIKQVVDDVLESLEGFNITKPGPHVPDTPTALDLVLTAVTNETSAIKNSVSTVATKMSQQHGGLQNHASFEDIFNKIGNCADRTANVFYNQQVYAIHSEQSTSPLNMAFERLERLGTYTKSVAGRSQGDAI